jgi:cytoskeletal protein RodZ
MQTIGERLEEARKRKGISVREAAETTKIRSDYLQKFEANSFDINLPPLYIRGFLSAYARYLELDPQRIVSDLNPILNSEGKGGHRDNREVYGRVDFGDNAGSEGKANVPASRSSQEQALMLKFGLLGGGAIVAIIAIILLIKVLFPSAPVKITPPLAATIQAETAQTLTLTATEATRVKIVQDLDGTVLLNAALARGESKSVKKQGKLLITVEAGKNLRMEVNGRNYAVPLEGYGRFALD